MSAMLNVIIYTVTKVETKTTK